MTALNDIPDYLKVDPEPESTPGSRLAWGILATISLGAALGLLLCWATMHNPMFTHHELLGFAGAFLATLLLFATIHRIADIRPMATCAVVATVCLLVVTKYITLLVYTAQSTVSLASLWARFGMMELVIGNYTSFCGIGIAAILCHKGEFGLGDLIHILMLNPLTGRRS